VGKDFRDTDALVAFRCVDKNTACLTRQDIFPKLTHSYEFKS